MKLLLDKDIYEILLVELTILIGSSHNLKLLVEFSILNGGKLSHLNSCLWGSVSLCMQMYPPILFQTIRNSIL